MFHPASSLAYREYAVRLELLATLDAFRLHLRFASVSAVTRGFDSRDRAKIVEGDRLGNIYRLEVGRRRDTQKTRQTRRVVLRCRVASRLACCGVRYV